MTAAPTRSTQGRRRSGLPALVSRTFMASARRDARRPTRRLPAYGSESAAETSGTAEFSDGRALTHARPKPADSPHLHHRDVDDEG